MKAHDWFIDHRMEFALRILDDEDQALYHEHVGRCEECRNAVRDMEDELRWLPMGATPVPPRPGFHRRVTEEVVGHRKRGISVWLAPIAAAASIILALVIWRTGTGRVAELDRELAATRDTLSLLRSADRILQATIEMDGKRGGMLIFADENTHRWKVVVHGIPAAPNGERYTFWFVTGDGMVRGPDVICDEKNPAVITLDMPPGARLIRGGALTMEPMTDGPVPQGKELAHLEL